MKKVIVTSIGLVLGALSSTAAAGTYSVVGITVYSQTATGGGFINFGSYDVEYGAVKSAGAQTQHTESFSPSVMSQFKWKVRWTASFPGENPPLSVTARVAKYGHAYAYTWCQIYGFGNYRAAAGARWTDPYTPVSTSSLVVNNGYDSDPVGSLTDSHKGYFYLGADFQYVSPGVYESLVDCVVNSLGSVSAECQAYGTYAVAGAQLDTKLKLRIIDVAGQTVAADF